MIIFLCHILMFSYYPHACGCFSNSQSTEYQDICIPGIKKVRKYTKKKIQNRFIKSRTWKTENKRSSIVLPTNWHKLLIKNQWEPHSELSWLKVEFLDAHLQTQWLRNLCTAVNDGWKSINLSILKAHKMPVTFFWLTQNFTKLKLDLTAGFTSGWIQLKISQ